MSIRTYRLTALMLVLFACRGRIHHSPQLFACGSQDSASAVFPVQKDFPSWFPQALRDAYYARPATGVRSKFWTLIPNKPVELSITFSGKPSDSQKSFVLEAAKAWSSAANVRFTEKPSGGVIRILITNLRVSWSEIGNDVLDQRKVSPLASTMRLGINRDISDDAKRAIILHEFGHALGLVHEHQHPCQSIVWNEKAIMKDLAGFLTRDQIRSQIEAKYSSAEVLATDAPDPESVMLYPIPADWTQNHVSFAMGTTLSQNDKAFIEGIYPFRSDQDIRTRARRKRAC